MTTLDSLARSSASAVHSSVASVPVPVRGTVWTAGWFYFRRSLGYALVGSAAALAAVVALMLVSTPSEEVADVTATTAATPITTATPTTVAPPTTVTQNTTPPTLPPTPTEPSAPVVVPPSDQAQPPADTVTPRIQILSPDPDSSVKTSSVLVVGLTEPGAKVTYPADRPIEVGEDGMWSVEVRLEAGENRLTFTATDAAGNQATASVTVTRVVDRPRVTTTTTKPPDATTTTTTTKPPDTTTTTTKPPVEWTFTAHNTYGSCEEDPPYDVYFGTGKPGTAITISSEFGGGTTEVGENGEWSLKVFFPEAPTELVFTVKVTDFTGAKVHFEFVSHVAV
jgi:outer membrane biosynthesis protein TonB